MIVIGCQFIQKLRSQFEYKHPVLIYCGDIESAKTQCKSQNTIENVYVTRKPRLMREFIEFKHINKSMGFEQK